MRRLARVYPLYIAMTALTIALLMRHAGVLPWLVGNAGELISNMLMVQNWGLSQSIVVAAWSVSVEALAYVGFPLLSFVFLYGSAALLVAATLLCLCGLIFIGLYPVTSSHLPNGMLDIHQDYSLLPAIRCLAGFGLGLCTYRYASRGNASPWRLPPMACVIGSLLLLASLFIPKLDLLSVCLIPLLILCLLDDTIIARALRTRAMKFLGEISYALYLVHGDVLVIADRMMATHAAQAIGRPAAITLALVFFVAFSVALAYAAHTFFEVPARAWIRRLEVMFDSRAERLVMASERQGQTDLS
jgi:peptidoglycan/LPS O-acetylase OafA/YrhL